MNASQTETRNTYTHSEREREFIEYRIPANGDEKINETNKI